MFSKWKHSYLQDVASTSAVGKAILKTQSLNTEMTNMTNAK